MPKIYLVGGAVRDQLLNLKSNDLDYVITGLDSFEQLKNFVLKQLQCRIVVETPDYGVIKAVHSTLGGLDFALPRLDYDQDGRQSKVKFVKTIEEDLARRDFTMNALAIEVDYQLNQIGTIIDPYGGINDINNKIIRFVGDPQIRINEDNLRVLRSLRFAITKDFDISFEDSKIIKNIIINDKTSSERIFTEMNKMFYINNTKTINLLIEHNQLYLLDKIKIKTST